jgi:hypothetical protein
MTADERVSDAELTAAIAATEKAIRAMGHLPGGLVDCDKISLRAMKELQARRALDVTTTQTEKTK